MSDLLLITGANSLLAHHAIEALHKTRRIRAVDTQFDRALPERGEARAGDLHDLAFTRPFARA